MPEYKPSSQNLSQLCVFIYKGEGVVLFVLAYTADGIFFSLLQKTVLPRVDTSCADLEEWQGRGAKTLLSDPLPRENFLEPRKIAKTN